MVKLFPSMHDSAGEHVRPSWNNRWKLPGTAADHQQDQGQVEDWHLPRHLPRVCRRLVHSEILVYSVPIGRGKSWNF